MTAIYEDANLGKNILFLISKSSFKLYVSQSRFFFNPNFFVLNTSIRKNFKILHGVNIGW